MQERRNSSALAHRYDAYNIILTSQGKVNMIHNPPKLQQKLLCLFGVLYYVDTNISTV